MKFKWISNNHSEETTPPKIEGLTLPPILHRLLHTRGISDFEAAKAFFRPDLSDLHPPLSMNQMDLAIERITKGLDQGETFMIYGDYDVDGTTSVALVYSYLCKKTSKISAYIPDRYTEGYGLSFAGIDEAKKRGATLMIVLDCGTKAIEKVDYAVGLGIDIIICDHHRPGTQLPNSVALLNPKREDNLYPDTNLSACGIGFKLIQGLEENLGGDVTNLSEYLDLVAVSIASDIVPVLGENRVLATFGLKQINHSPRNAFNQLLGEREMDATLTDLVFKIGPKINAAGRIEHGMRAVEFLLSDSPEDSIELLKNIQENNETRRDLDAKITKEALLLAEEQNNRMSTVVYSPNWHKGVVGIVASRLIESHYKPTIVLTQSGAVIAGSARSVFGFDIHDALENCSEYLSQFGGHMYAAGMTLEAKNLELFSSAFEKEVQKTLPEELKTPALHIDAELTLDQLTPKFYRVLSQFEPFGPENMKPLFCSRDLQLLSPKKVGGDKSHLKAYAHCPSSQITLDVIGFGLAKKFDKIGTRTQVDLVYHLEINAFRGDRKLQLVLKDLVSSKESK